MYLTYRYTGVLGLGGVALLMVFAAGILVRAGLMAVGAPDERASAAGGIAVLLLVGWLKPWPQAGVYALFAAYLYLSLRGEWGPRDILLAGALSLLWGNIHSTAVMFPLCFLRKQYGC